MLTLVDSNTSQSRPSRPIAAALALVLSVLGAFAPQARADTRYVVPTSDGVSLRCGSGTAWYAVATLNKGSILKADSESEGWVRVDYPKGTPVVVKADEADVKEADKKVILTRRSRLRAYSPATPVLEECFKAVLDEFLNPGAELRYLGAIKSRDTDVGGYLVEAPAGAKGFIAARDVRDATPDEVKKFEGQAPVAVALPPAPAPTQPTAAAPANATPPAPTTLTTGAPPTGDAATPAPTAEAPIASPEPAKASGPTLRQLDRAFETMMKEPLDRSDPQELIEQYNKLDDGLGEGRTAERTREYVSARVQVLELRKQARELLPAIAALQQSAQDATKKYAVTIERLAKNREYVVVGRLLPSTLYDGQRLPLMYRLSSIDAASGRTLAYLTPEPGLDLDKKIGAVVGVLGDGTNDPSANVNIFKPMEVDVLQAADGSIPGMPAGSGAGAPPVTTTSALETPSTSTSGGQQ